MNTYEAEIKDNILSMRRIQSHTERHFGKVELPPEAPINVTGRNLSYFTSPADPGFTYPIFGFGAGIMESHLSRNWRGFTAGSDTNYFKSGSDVLLSASDNVLQQLEQTATEENRTLSDAEIRETWLKSVHGIAQNTATGLTNL